MELTKEIKEKIDNYLKTKTPKELLDLFIKYGMEEIEEQLIIPAVVKSLPHDCIKGMYQNAHCPNVGKCSKCRGR